MSEFKLVTVFEAQGMLEAEVIKSKLDAAGIPALLRYESTGLVFGLTVGGQGRVDVQVPEELAEQAEALILEEGEAGADEADIADMEDIDDIDDIDEGAEV
jgi:hypothetical protein